MKTPTLTATIALAALLFAGCAGTETLEQRGSSTVLPLAERWAEEWGAESGVAVNVAGGGSGAGATGLCNGELDLADMSRAMKETEAQTCRAAGIEPVEWKVAFDALSVVVSTQNDFAEDLSVEELAHIFRRDGHATRWNEVDASFPDQPIRLCYPDSDSGTYEYFNEAILADAGGQPRTGSGVQQSSDDNVIVTCLSQDPYAIGYFGLAYLLENQASVKAVSVDGVEPSRQTVEGGAYTPLSRYLFIYTDGVPEAGSPLHDYLSYVFGEGQDVVPDVGYVPLDAPTRQAMVAQLG